MTEKRPSSAPERQRSRRVRFESKRPNRVGDALRQAFGTQPDKDETAREFDALLSRIN